MFAYIQKYPLQDEATDTGHTGGGGDLNVDINAVSDAIGADLGLNDDEPDSATPSPSGDAKKEAAPVAPKVDPNETPEAKLAREGVEREAKLAKMKPEERLKFEENEKAEKEFEAKFGAPPKSMAADKHAIYKGMSKEAKQYLHEREEQFHRGLDAYRQGAEYGQTVYKAFEPYAAVLKAQGITDHAKAVGWLLNAHYQLSSGDASAKASYFASLAKSYKLDVPSVVKLLSGAVDPNAQQTDPAIAAINERLNKQDEEKRAEQQRIYDETRSKVAQEVKTFAEDPKNEFFNEVAPQVALLLNDPNISLQQAYDQAVWANPVTRQKLQAKLDTEKAEALRKAAEEEARKKREARGTQVRGKETTGSTQEATGSMDDTLRETMSKIKSREGE